MYSIKNLKEYIPEILLSATIGYAHGKGHSQADAQTLHAGIMATLPLAKGMVSYKTRKEAFEQVKKNPQRTNPEKIESSKIEKAVKKRNISQSMKKTGKSAFITGASYTFGKYFLASVF